MPRYIIKLADQYLEWSTIVDAPVTYGMPLDEFNAYYKDKYGTEGMRELPERLSRVDKTGTSAMTGETLDQILSGNRAGKKEKELSKDEIIRDYVTNRKR